MHTLLEFIPIFGLGGGYFLGKSINPSEAMFYLSYGAIIGTVFQFIAYKAIKQKMQKMTLITGWLLIIFATMTIIFHNDIFVKLKPTVISWAFSLLFLGYTYFKKVTLLELMIPNFEMPAKNWITLNWSWVIFNFIIGLINIIIVWQISLTKLSNDEWVTFKISLLPISLIFIIGQTIYLFKKGKQKEIYKDNIEM